MYHSVALLIPDGRVFVAGGDWEPAQHQNIFPDAHFSGEIFYPPYLELGTQPEVTGAQGVVDFSTATNTVTFEVEVTVFHEKVDKVVLLRPGALTHHADMDQRYVELVFQVHPNDVGYTPSAAGVPITLIVTSPEESLGPAGYWMLFVVEDLDQSGPATLEDLIPSNGYFLRLKRR